MTFDGYERKLLFKDVVLVSRDRRYIALASQLRAYTAVAFLDKYLTRRQIVVDRFFRSCG